MTLNVNEQKDIIQKNIDEIEASQKELEEVSKKIDGIDSISEKTKNDIKESSDSLKEITKPLQNIKEVFGDVVGYILTPVAEKLEQSSQTTLDNLNEIDKELNIQGKKAAWHNFLGITLGAILSIISLPLINKFAPESWKYYLNNNENIKVVSKKIDEHKGQYITTKELFNLLNGYNLDFNNKIYEINNNFLNSINNNNKMDIYSSILKQIKNLNYTISSEKEKQDYEILYCNLELFKAYNISHDFSKVEKILNTVNFSKYNKDIRSKFKWIETEILINQKKYNNEKIIKKYSDLLDKQINIIDFETNHEIKLNEIVQKRLNKIYKILMNQDYKIISSTIDNIINNKRISKQIKYQFLWIKAELLKNNEPYKALNIYNQLADSHNDIKVLDFNNRLISISQISKIRKQYLESDYIPKNIKKIVLLHSNKQAYPKTPIALPAKKRLTKIGYNTSNIIATNLSKFPASTIYVYYKNELDKKNSKNILNIIYPNNKINIDYTKISEGIGCEGIRRYSSYDIVIRLPKPPT